MLDRIRASLPALSPAEQRVAALVLADARGFAGRRAGRARRGEQADRGAGRSLRRSLPRAGGGKT